MITQLIQAFQDEADELLSDLELSLLELEQNPDNGEIIGNIFRSMHTIKGSSAMFGFEGIAALSHDVETLLDLLRSGVLHATREMIVLILQARDQIKSMLGATGESPEVDARAAGISAAIRKIVEVAVPLTEPTNASTPTPEPVDKEGELTLKIEFRPDREIFRRGLNPIQILNELRDLGSCRITVRTEEVPNLADLDPELCYLGWDIELTTSVGINAVKDVFMFVGEESRVDIVSLLVHSDLEDEEAEFMDEAAMDLASHRHGEIYDRAIAETKAISSIRVTAEKLDHLVNLVGELVTAQARFSQISIARNDTELITLSEEVERLTAGLRDTALNIRMVPIGSTFGRFRRLVHDLAIELGKDVELVTTGAETELDKTVIEKLNDPLVHLIRNSIDHGIESPEIRLAEGKSAKGTIHLSAIHSGDSVLVTIKDDGCGINRESVRSRGLERGLIQPGAELSDKEIFGLIFSPGFSTAEKVTSISGRGVGMDVVKKGVDALRGTISVTSGHGDGTAVTIRLPLTLAIIESLLVKIGNDCFVIPLAMVEECIELTSSDIARAHGRHLVNVRGRITPYIPLRERFGIAGDRPEIEQIVIVELEDRQVGLVVDHVIGEHQTVIKSIGRMFREVEGISGATILGDGSLALILDVQQLIRDEERREDRETILNRAAVITEELQRRESYA